MTDDLIRTALEYCKTHRVEIDAEHQARLVKAAKKQRKYQLNNRGLITAIENRRRAAKLKRIPKWITKQDLKDIKEFIKACPEGCHIDHYYPLQGEHVSGLHVLANLRYLPVNINCSKGNKTPGIDWPETIGE